MRLSGRSRSRCSGEDGCFFCCGHRIAICTHCSTNRSCSMLDAMKWLTMAGILIWINACGWAQAVDVPKVEYLSYCAACHGAGGKGDGPLSVKLTTKPADLTVLSRKNKGVFPVSAVYAAIDGRNVNASHRTGEMPVWGCRSGASPVSPIKNARSKVYKPDPYASHLDLACDPEDVIANRILSVIEYLRQIQE
jgi:mono/diheme cytochrome c family protein